MLCGRSWRSRGSHLFRYIDGAWKWRGDRIEFAAHDELIAVGGLFIPPATGGPSWQRLVKIGPIFSGDISCVGIVSLNWVDLANGIEKVIGVNESGPSFVSRM